MKQVFLFLLLICTWFSIQAQERPYINYTTHSGLPQIQVMAVHQDPSGYIWAGTKSGIVKFNGESFEHFLPKERIFKINSDSQGRVYVKTYDKLFRYDGKEMKLLSTFSDISRVFVGDDDYWLVSAKNLINYSDSIEICRFEIGKDIKGAVNSVGYDKANKKLHFSSEGSKEIHSCCNGKIKKEEFNTDCKEVRAVDFNGTIAYIEVLGNTDRYIDPESLKEFFTVYKTNNLVDSIQVKHLPIKSYLFSHDYSYFLLDSVLRSSTKIDLSFIKAPYPVIFDRDNNIWSGSDNGLYQVFNGVIKNYPRSFMNDVWTLIKGADQEFYGAVFKEALYRYDFNNETKSEIVAPGPYNRKETDYYYGASKDSKGDLYFPTHYGLVKYDYKQTKKFDTGISLISKYDSLSNQVVFGQMNGLGFIDENENVKILIDSSKRFIASHPSAIEFDEDGNIWVGTKSSLGMWNRQEERFTSTKVCPSQTFTVIHRDKRNNVWLGGKNGLWLYNGKTNECKRIAEGIIDNNITDIISSDNNFLVIGTSLEIFVMDLKAFFNAGELKIKLFNFRNGFLSEEVCQNGFLLDRNLLYVPSTTCTSVLNLDKINFDADFYDVRISKLNDEGIVFSDTLSRSLYTMCSGCNELDFSFETIGFGLPTSPMFKYKLDGVDDEWSPWTTKEYANYRNLASGKYCFHVMARPGGNPNLSVIKEDHIHICISLPFYKEPRFYQHALFGFILLTLILGFFVHSRFHIKLKMIDRERKIKLLEIATLQAQLNPHFIFNILSSVQNLISLHKPEIANEYLIKFSRLIRSYMEASIKSSKVLLGASVSSEISVKEEVDLLRMYIELEKVKHNSEKFDFKIDVSTDSLLNRTIPPMILQPLVENAIKHGLEPKEEMGFLQISFSELEEGVKCVIKDDGIGREKSEELKKESIKLYQSRGVELINKKIEILNDLDYQIRLEYAETNVGTEVHVIFSN